MNSQTTLDAELDNKKHEMMEVRKTTILGYAENNNTYIIQIDKTVFWLFLFIINYPMLSDAVKWLFTG